MNERPYYETVRNWLLSSEGRCFEAAVDTGPKLARPDVLGVRHVGGDLATDYELIAVEVKTDESFFRSAAQASGYRLFAHRCYLAEYERGSGDFSAEELEVATSLGIGLIKLRSRNADGLHEYLSAPLTSPRPRFTLQALESIGLSSCTLCRGLFKGTHKQGVKRADRTNVALMLRRAIALTTADVQKVPTGFLFWSDRTASMKEAAGDGNAPSARRYICPDCLVNIIGPLLTERDERRKAIGSRLPIGKSI